MTSETVCRFEGEGQVSAVMLNSGICLEAQLVIECIGINGNGQLTGVAGAGCTKGTQAAERALAGIEVNDRMETGIPDIYACGDCAEEFFLAMWI